MSWLLLFTLACNVALFASDNRPQFEEFRVAKMYRGNPVAPRLTTKNQRLFRTMIRQGAKSEVQFAGHYTVPRWGCGSTCVDFALADSISGQVYEPTFYVSGLPMSWLVEQTGTYEPPRLDFRPDSRLLKVNGCLNERRCGFFNYVMLEGQGLKLIREELLPKAYQPR